MNEKINASKIIIQAIQLHKQGKLEEAKELYDKYIELNPDNVDILIIYAQVLTALNEYNNAINVYLSVLNISQQEEFDVLYQISVLYLKTNNIEESLNRALQAFKIKNNDVKLLLHIASLYHNMNLTDKELYYLEKIAEIDTNNEFIMMKLAITYKNNKNYKKALLYSEKCLAINPDNVTVLSAMALLLIRLKQYDSAYSLISKAYQLQPNDISIYNALFLLNMETRSYEEAITVAKKIIELEPANCLGYACLGQVYFEYVDYKMALDCYNKVLELKPNDLDSLYNKACCFEKLKLYDESKKVIDIIINLYPDYIQAIKLLSFIYLEQKEYEKGMETYFFLVSPEVMAKLDNSKVNSKFREYYKKHWNKENIENKKLLIYNNAGAGDFLMFSRYIKYLENKNVEIILEAEKNFLDIFKNSFKNTKIIEEKNDIVYTDYDYTTSIMALLYNTQLDFNNIPYPEGWLKADDSLVEEFSKYEIFNTNKIKVGIFWRGNLNILRNRFIELEKLTPIFELSDKFSFYSLDIEEKSPEIFSLFEKYNIHDCSKYIKTFNDTAAILKNLDFIITIDSSICHLAGGLGIKTYLLLPENIEWRWFNGTKETCWYNSVTIFRQKRQSDWNSVVDELKQELLSL